MPGLGGQLFVNGQGYRYIRGAVDVRDVRWLRWIGR